jgi:hypothetical protein
MEHEGALWSSSVLSEPSADVADINNIGIFRRPTRPITLRAENHAIFIWIKPSTYLYFAHPLHLPILLERQTLAAIIIFLLQESCLEQRR